MHSSTYQLPPKEIITPEDQAYFYYANKNPLDPTFNESLQNAILTRVPLVNNRTFIGKENLFIPIGLNLVLTNVIVFVKYFGSFLQ